MAQTYTPLAPNATPTQGTSGDAVKALQTALNTKYQGQAGYTPLKVDGYYGPLTAAAAAYKPATPTPTIGQAYNLPTPVDSPDLIAARNAYDTFTKNQAGGVPNVDENAIRNSVLSQFQGEIDAVNNIYADKMRQARITGAGRLGSDTAIQARRGLVGSDFGNAETSTVNSGNDQIYSGIDNEKAAAINAILTKARDAGTAAIAEKTKAIGEGLDAHLKYLSDSGARKATNATAAAQFIYSQKLAPSDLTPDQLQKTADGYGVTKDDIINAYTGVKKTGDEAAATKAAAELKAKKEGLTVIPAGSKVIDSTGKEVGFNPKVALPKSSTVSTKPVVSGAAIVTPDKLTSISNELEKSRGPDKYVDPMIYQQAYDAWTSKEVGGLAKDFLRMYPPKKYVNPANNTLPSYLRSSSVKSKPSETAPSETTPSGRTI